MSYKTIPVKDMTYHRLLALVKGKESWDETINRIIDVYEAKKR